MVRAPALNWLFEPAHSRLKTRSFPDSCDNKSYMIYIYTDVCMYIYIYAYMFDSVIHTYIYVGLIWNLYTKVLLASLGKLVLRGLRRFSHPHVRVSTLQHGRGEGGGAVPRAPCSCIWVAVKELKLR